MKRIFFSLSLLIALAITGCIKNDLVTWTGSQVEFDAASWNANAAGLTYPILTRVPVYGGAANSTNSPTLITRTTGQFQLRVNLVGPQKSTDQTFNLRVVPGESTAVEGTHYAPIAATGVIPANSSFGYVTVNILNPGASTGSKILVLELTSNDVLQASVNYAKLGLSIAQN
jgi:hypothetical protein